MAQLKTTEKRYFENLFNMESGYVLDFSNHEFARLINDTVGLNIYDSKYEYIGNSKAKRLRAFWALETDFIVGKVLSEIPEGAVGFVYIIHRENLDIDVSSPIKYIGKKNFYAQKGKKESDWKKYYGSSEWLKTHVNRYTKDVF